MTSALSPFAIYAPKLLDAGYSPIPILPPDCGIVGAGKAPGCMTEFGPRGLRGWQNYANLPEGVAAQIDEWSGWPGFGVGVCANRQLVAIDVDTDHPMIESAIAEAIGRSPVIKRGSVGFTAFFQQSTVRALQKTAFSFESGERAVDIIATGGQTVVPPSIHPSALRPYAWIGSEDLANTPPRELPMLAPTALADIAAALDPFQIRQGHGQRKARGVTMRPSAIDRQGGEHRGAFRELNDEALERLGDWVPSLGLHGLRQCGPDKWAAVAHWRPSSRGRALAERAPNLAITPQGIVDFGDGHAGYTPLDLIMAARGCEFGAAFDWLLDALAPELREFEASVANVIQLAERRRDVAQTREEPAAPAAPATVHEFTAPADLDQDDEDELAAQNADADWDREWPAKTPRLNMRTVRKFAAPLVRDLWDHIYAQHQFDWRYGALAPTLSVLSAGFGKFWAWGETRTNLNVVLLAKSGIGKSKMRDALFRIAYASEGKDLLKLFGPEKFTSPKSLLRRVHEAGRLLSVTDECQDWLGELANRRAGEHKRAVLTEITALATAASSIHMGTAYADESNDIPVIRNPHLCTLWLGVPDPFWANVSGAMSGDGKLARFLVLQEDARPAPKEVAPVAHGRMAEALEYAFQMPAGASNPEPYDTNKITAQAVSATPEAEAAIDRIRVYERRWAEHIEDVLGEIAGGSILRRLTEFSSRLALINAVARDAPFGAPIVTEDDVRFGYEIARHGIARSINMARQHVSETDHERAIKRLLATLRDAEDAGLSDSVLRRRMAAIDDRAFDGVTRQLKRARMICEATTATKGRPRRRWFIGANAPEGWIKAGR